VGLEHGASPGGGDIRRLDLVTNRHEVRPHCRKIPGYSNIDRVLFAGSRIE
jgi:hypothetical protein